MKSWADLSLGKSEGYGDAYKTLTLYNTTSQQIEELPIKTLYRLYVCGITPYDATHLGHAATYVALDRKSVV
jgi:L-cysteine:1D-myo-inositol 2-amino-2-deoxy-alpha-D-glucopyranoside ligase